MQTKLKAIWNGNMKGRGRIEANRLEIPVAIPSELGGTGEGADPKTLLISSAATCYLMTLVAILQNRRLPMAGLTLESAVSEHKEAGFNIEHQIQVNLPPEATQEQIDAAGSAFEAADRACAIGNILKKADVQIIIVGSVSVGEPAAA